MIGHVVLSAGNDSRNLGIPLAAGGHVFVCFMQEFSGCIEHTVSCRASKFKLCCVTQQLPTHGMAIKLIIMLHSL